MRKLWKAAVMMFVMSCAACLCLGATAFAAEYKGDLGDGFKWTFDSKTETLSISGRGVAPAPDDDAYGAGEYWASYEDSIRHIYLEDGVTSVSDMLDAAAWRFYSGVKIETFGGQAQGMSWLLDMESKTLTISGRGMFPQIDQFHPVYWTAFNEGIEHIVIEDGVTGFVTNDWIASPSTLKIGKNCGTLLLRSVKQSIDVDVRNPYLASYDGCLYNKRYESIIFCPREKTSIRFHPNVKVIGSGAFGGAISEIIIPWGVYSIENSAFSDIPLDSRTLIVVPDTTALVHTYIFTSIHNRGFTLVYSKNNKGMKEAIGTYRKLNGNDWMGDIYEVDSVAPYYEDSPGFVKPGWQTKNGEKYYINANGQKLIGWQQIDRAWYCFRSDGAMLTNQWMKWHNVWYFLRPSGLMSTNEWFRWNKCWYYTNSNGSMAASKWVLHKGKYYYLRPSGIMATNEWIKGRDGYWYYVDNDGVMMTNAWTPDGHYVNGSGVRTK